MDDLESRIPTGAGSADLARTIEERLGRLGPNPAPSAVALEVVRLAEQIAERMDLERRLDREIAIARDVQRRLFPQRVPELPHVQLAARCIQARSVGGDYYDFLDLGQGRVGLVLGDVSGKGVHAALRMANLQAHLRSQAGGAPQDPLRVLRQANRMLWESTHAGDFATLFFGVFADPARRLTYINCGHNPPVCMRRDGTIEWLTATATVLGAFEEWECALGRTQLAAGDLLVAYSDGVTEARRGREHFGEERLIQALRSRPDAAPDAIVSEILDRVQAFSAGDQSDDLTLLVARVR
jgi:serine phosphatase RsbU (regulator of sigma subunit)